MMLEVVVVMMLMMVMMLMIVMMMAMVIMMMMAQPWIEFGHGYSMHHFYSSNSRGARCSVTRSQRGAAQKRAHYSGLSDSTQDCRHGRKSSGQQRQGRLLTNILELFCSSSHCNPQSPRNKRV
jgi:hypothetical protein